MTDVRKNSLICIQSESGQPSEAPTLQMIFFKLWYMILKSWQ